MAWLAAAIFGVAVIYFAIHYPGFRKVVLWCVAIAVALGVAGGAYFYWDSLQQAKRTAYAKTLIHQDEVDFYDMKMSGDIARSVRGMVRNRSAYTLRSFRLGVVVQDCPDVKCETIGEDEAWVSYIDVPPGQVRAFDTYVNFSHMPTPKAMQWNYRVTELQAKVD
jgi:hypothetical protein